MYGKATNKVSISLLSTNSAPKIYNTRFVGDNIAVAFLPISRV